MVTHGGLVIVPAILGQIIDAVSIRAIVVAFAISSFHKRDTKTNLVSRKSAILLLLAFWSKLLLGLALVSSEPPLVGTQRLGLGLLTRVAVVTIFDIQNSLAFSRPIAFGNFHFRSQFFFSVSFETRLSVWARDAFLPVTAKRGFVAHPTGQREIFWSVSKFTNRGVQGAFPFRHKNVAQRNFSAVEQIGEIFRRFEILGAGGFRIWFLVVVGAAAVFTGRRSVDF